MTSDDSDSGGEDFRIVGNPVMMAGGIKFRVGSGNRSSIRIYGVDGRLVKVVVQHANVLADHSLLWDGTDESGAKVSPGIYFCRMDTPLKVTRKLVLLK